MDPERITGAKAGELFVHRNIGNIVPLHDWNLGTVIEYAVNHLKVDDIVICGHSNCGAIKSLDHEGGDHYIPLWLNNAVEAKRRVDSRIQAPKTPEEEKNRLRLIEIENVGLQIEHLQPPPVRPQKKRGGSRFTASTRSCHWRAEEDILGFQNRINLFFIRSSEIFLIGVSLPLTR